MIIFFGTRGIDKHKDSGHFYCPACSDKRSYTHKEVKRWFTLYFIPVIPLGSAGEFVQCDYCNMAFEPKVLEWDPDHDHKLFLAAFAGAVKRVMAMAALADDRGEPPNFETSREIYGRATAFELQPGEMEHEMSAAQTDGMGLAHYVPPLMPRMDDPMKERLLLAAHEASMLRGMYSPGQRRLVDELGSLLQMTPAHVQGVLSQASYRAPH